MDSQFIMAAKFKAKGIVHPAAPKLRPSLTAEADGRYSVQIKATVTPELLAAIKAAGGTVTSSFPAYHVVKATLPVENIESIAGRADVVFISQPSKASNNYIDSEGDSTHNAIVTRANYGVDGAGVTVGILSDSLDNGSNALADAISDGNIDPTNTFYITGQEGTGEGEGLAMCEIVHDLAPGATIWFATGAAGEEQMASNIIALANAGCTIIADDEAYNDESPFQDQVIAQAIQTVTSNGVLYFSCARNSGNLDSYTNSDKTIAAASTWEGNFTPVGPYYTDQQYPEYWNNFAALLNQTARENPIDVGGYDYEADLFWTDPLGASTNDYDLYMYDSIGDIVYMSENTQDGTQDPYEHIDDTAQYSSGYYLVITLYSGVSRFMYMGFGRGALYWASVGCTKGHNACDAHNSFTVAATPAAAAQNAGQYQPSGPYPDVFNSGNIVETFSADGPRRMFYYSDGTPITPTNFSATGGTVYLKPDLTAADGVSTTPPGFAPFFGTSAATPHAAAIAALVWSYNPALTPDQVHDILTNSCIDIMNKGWDRDSGYGILMADMALKNTPAPTSTGPTNTTTASGPTPTIVQTGGSILLTWPTTATGFTLQSTSALGPNAVWTTVSPGPLVIGGENVQSIGIMPGQQQFFRLGN